MKHLFSFRYFLAGFIMLGILSANSFAQCAPEKAGTALPGFSVVKTNGIAINPYLLPVNQPIIVIYFDPYCDHCETQAGWIKEKIADFKGITILWVSWGEMEDLQMFEKKFLGGINKDDMYVTKDTEFEFDSWFGYSEVPSIYVYNAKRVRTMCFKKETPAETLLKYVK